ncbi:alkaline phosphatase family protein [Zobellia galactanivorans]|uniref:Type I phosphodiesterase n=1 Tax=Zobellia galactanivorans (strain DSM 12802 / CCUG 47099 / CIP 106680 / NCIMB 13871 / Dsij) TaxID=63186 RepID=G0L9G6_ZOBGA|nr:MULTISPECIES: nucleotide pyrophosphatase/phosphodiesterase family protein [Zobellia]MBU3026998.1 alkaline phosphatase family protein [Zobellia galactanivorans]MDO6810260.1 alkaline phosphatase family protein [Zobellia galactanivorans]OWW23847.1 alkaline phosphatase family protein [Zobellia sp. OII3]CAZ94562.1 Type I phosphodiesterase [Zobellia galactanivorans]
MKKTLVINVVGLTQRLIGEHTPFIESFLKKGKSAYISPVLPAVTCSVQSTYLTGKTPSEHGVVGNGWYFKEECEVKFWRQSNKLVQSEKLWDELKREDEHFTCANHFWWYNMYSNVDYSLTPRPNYLADGRKIPDVYSYPPELRDTLQEELGTFPLFQFWGPKTSIKSSKWIADAAIRTDEMHNPTLSLVYLPHLDYNLQRHGLDFTKIKKDLKEIDGVVEQLVTHFQQRNARIVLLSEYGITDVSNPIHLNRILRSKGYIAIREERGLELLDAGQSKAFAVADHQIAHVYLNDPSVKLEVKALLESVSGVEMVLTGEELQKVNLQHERCGDLVVVADADSWFTYYFWLDDAKAPDYARMVDIHKKPGYDPVEMLTDPKDKLVMAKVIGKLLKKKLGFRTVMNIIPLDATLVKGSHGRIPEDKADFPILVTDQINATFDDAIEATDVYQILKNHVTEDI